MTDEQAGPEVQRGDAGGGGENEVRVLPVAPVPSVGGMSVGGHLGAAAGGLMQPIGGLIPAPGQGQTGASDDADGDTAGRVEAALAGDGRLRIAALGVAVNDGVVELTGSVATERERRTAEEICAAEAGVRAVRNLLAVV